MKHIGSGARSGIGRVAFGLGIVAAMLTLNACASDGGAGEVPPTSDATADATPAPEATDAESPFPCFEDGRAVPDVPGVVTAGTGTTAVVFVNGAAQSACVWSDFAADIVAAGHQVYAYDYATDAPPVQERTAELQAVVAAAKDGGAERVVLVGGSRGGCLSLIAAAENPEVSDVVVLSCAKVSNRQDPTDLAPFLPKVSQPVLEFIATADPDVPVDEVRADADALPAAEVVEVPGGSHGSALVGLDEVSTRILQLLSDG